MIRTDICVIGAGSGGLSVAAGAVQMGARVVLVEGAEMGGDCLNTGCVPSKALIAAAEAAAAMRGTGRFGIGAVEPAVDFGAVKDHVAGVIATIAPVDSQARFEGLGCTVLRDWARFVSPREVEVGGERVRARSGIGLLAGWVPEARIVLWLAYGLLIGSWPLIGANLVTLVLVGIILAFRQVIRLYPEVAWVNNFRIADPAAYALGPQALKLPARDILFVSSNGWDALGATWYGYTTLWVNRSGAPPEALEGTPTRTGATLRDVLDFFPPVSSPPAA